MTATNGAAMKAKGSAFEREVVRVLRQHGHPHAARAYGAGRREDVGDVVGLTGFVVEAKAHRALDLARWADEAAREAANAGPAAVPVVVAKRRGRPAEDAYALLRLADLADLAAELVRLRRIAEAAREVPDPYGRHERRGAGTVCDACGLRWPCPWSELAAALDEHESEETP